jgi:hypothetical protein
VGQNTPHKYIVVNIHYLKKVTNDQSGLALTFSATAPLYQAGILLLVTGNIQIPPKAAHYTADVSCKYTGKSLNVFAYRVHAHARGDVNAAYRVRSHEWTQLAKGDPQWPQVFSIELPFSMSPSFEFADFLFDKVLFRVYVYNTTLYRFDTH